ncbi:hypothetical protein D3C80_1037320 [compost metagenome]
MDSLRKTFGDQLFILPVTDQPVAIVASFLNGMQKANGRKGFSACGDTQLKKLFPYQQLPHYVWIDGDGVVLAITDGQQVNSANIQQVLDKQPVHLKLKKDHAKPYDPTQPLLAGKNNISANSILNSHVLTSYVEGYPSLLKANVTGDSVWSVVGLNLSIAQLYKLAYSRFDMALMSNNARLKILTKDSLRVTGPNPKRVGKDAWMDWYKANAYCYEARRAAPLKEKVWAQMQRDLDESFPDLQCAIEKQTLKCLVLVRSGKENLLASKGGTPQREDNKFSFLMQNTNWQYFISRLQLYYLQTLPTPLIDETGIMGPVDLNIQANLQNVEELQAALQRYGLNLIEAERTIDVIVIRDRELINSSTH